MLRKIISSALICSAFALTVFGAEISEITEKWSELKPSYFGMEQYEEIPSAGDEWKAGKLQPGFVKDGFNYLNFCRFVAGLPEFEYIDQKGEKMQMASIIYSYDVYNDGESVPVGMNEEFYNAAYEEYSASNKAFGFEVLDKAVAGMINDRGAQSRYAPNRAKLLMPHGGGVTFGFYGGYTTALITPSADDFIYDFIAWPVNSNFPLQLMSDNLPWTVKLNSEHYTIPENAEIMVILENVSPEISITLTSENKYSFYEGSSAFLDVDRENNTIIFKPSHSDLKPLIKNGAKIRVKVFGITTTEGEETSLQYVVNLFDLNTAILERYADYNDISSHQSEAVASLTASGVFKGYPDNTFRPHDTITRAEFTASLLRYMNIEPYVNPEQPFSDVSEDHWARGYIDKAFEIGAVNGTDPGIFSPEEPVTVEQAMKIVTVVKGFTERVDIEASGGYPFAYFNLGYELRLLDNVEEELERPLTRSDVACIFNNATDIIKFWTEPYYDTTIVWHRDRSGKGYGYYSLVKFK